MYQVIARKYRPQSFAELVGQDHVKTTLENAIRQNRIAHGYILSGQRGTGKTTVARILARCLNCVDGPTSTPCGTCASCVEIAAGNAPDVIEIDAASNRGINEMRELRENVRYRPARDRYKVFIIDEAHQITSEAFNALLKTLEEPPEWVVFVLCTTEAHKIPATIASRCQHFSFRSIDFDDVIGRMDYICREEKIQADAGVLAVLAQAGDGSVRDSLSALDQAIACCGTELKEADVRALLGAFSLDSLGGVTEALRQSDPAAMLSVVDELERNGHNLQQFCRELSRYLRNLVVAKIAGESTRLIAATPDERKRLAEIAAAFSEEDLTRYLQIALDLYGELQRSLQPRLHMEIGLLRMVHAGRLMPIEEALAIAGGAAPAPVQSAPQTRTPRPQKAAPESRAQAAPRPAAPPAANPSAGGGDWRSKLIVAFRELGMSFTADAIEHSEVTEASGELRFLTPKEFKLSMKDADIRRALAHLGAPSMRFKVTIGESAPDAPESAAPAPPPDEDEEKNRALSHPEVQRFRDIFGGEVRTVRNLKE
ncbi:MAG: DNA polymerase III subunit gamma/tau [Bryobacteraceae bacterium]